MSKRKADNLSHIGSNNETKKAKHEKQPAASKRSLLDDSDSGSSSEDDSDGGAQLEQSELKVNEEYAKRFEHNKKREELQKLEEKFKKPAKPVNGQYGDKYDEDSESSDDEDEDDEGFLATEALDAEITATLQAIRSKDPRVYDEKVTFYAPIEAGDGEAKTSSKTDKPMFLSDYHRENLLKGHTGADEVEDAPRTFAQEQDDLKKSIVKEMHAAAEDSDDEKDEDGGFLVPKSKPQKVDHGKNPARAKKITLAAADVAVAEKDPETFLSNFMAARAWVPGDGGRVPELLSDDDEEDERAETFEAAYNMRFEDPKGSNEMLKSYARDIVAAKSVRREEPKSRKKVRDAQREKREAEKAEREEEKAQFRRLKMEETEEKLNKFKKAAGIRGALKEEEWAKFLETDFADDQWDTELSKHFGEEYYAAREAGSQSEDDGAEGSKKKKKVKKPKWDDDIDINDLVPEFEDEEKSRQNPGFTLTDSEDDGAAETIGWKKPSKARQEEKAAKKKDARLERKKIETLVDKDLDLDLPSTAKQTSLFRYRETSPTTFGLTARDILMAPDASLNQFAGLKKMAAFRDAEKKRKDKKNLSKKARLRNWRKETFGNEDGPEIIIGGNAADEMDVVEADGNVVEGKKRKRSRKSKVKVQA